MNQTIQSFTHIGRPIDPRYPTNLAIAIIIAITTVSMFIFQLLSGTNLFLSTTQAIVAALTIFLVWAFAREIDPEEQLSAFMPVLLMLIVLFTLDVEYNLIALFYLMSLARIVNRSIGLAATLADSIIMLIFTGLVAYLSGWIYALVAVIAFLLDAVLPDANHRHRVFALLAFIVMIIAFVLQSGVINLTIPSTNYLIATGLAGLVFIPIIWKAGKLSVSCDISPELLSPLRVRATQIMVLIFAFIIAFWQGNQGILALLPLWLVFAGTGLFPLIKPFLPDINLEMRSVRLWIDDPISHESN